MVPDRGENVQGLHMSARFRCTPSGLDVPQESAMLLAAMPSCRSTTAAANRSQKDHHPQIASSSRLPFRWRFSDALTTYPGAEPRTDGRRRRQDTSPRPRSIHCPYVGQGARAASDAACGVDVSGYGLLVSHHAEQADRGIVLSFGSPTPAHSAATIVQAPAAPRSRVSGSASHFAPHRGRVQDVEVPHFPSVPAHVVEPARSPACADPLGRATLVSAVQATPSTRSPPA